MKDKYPKYLPIGSVVMLDGGKKRIMIIGYVPMNAEAPGQVYDYCGCLFPEGMMSSDKNLLFNHNQISQIYCLGYQDEEQKNFSSKISELFTEDNIKKMISEQPQKNNSDVNSDNPDSL